MNLVLAIALNTFREAIRNKILYSVVFFAALVIAASALFGKVTLGDTVRVIKDFGLFSLSFFGAILSIVIGVSLLDRELRLKTIYNILSKPVSRTKFILGKYLGLCLTSVVLISLMGLGLIAFTSVYSGQLETGLFEGLVYVILEVIIMSAVVIFFSSIVVTITLSGLFSLATWMAGRSFDSIGQFFTGNTSAAQEPSALAGFLTNLLEYALPDLTRLNVADAIVYGESAGAEHLAYAASYSVLYSAGLVLLAIIFFHKRELM